MAVFFSNPKARHESASRWVDRAGDDRIGTLLDYELRARALRCHMFDPDVINDSSWLLAQDLFAAHLRRQKMRTKELCDTSGLPQTTVIRYLDHLQRLDLVRREGDPDDSRATLVSMTEWGAYWMREYYSQVIVAERRAAITGRGLFALAAETEALEP
jgi:hypothetical protein